MDLALKGNYGKIGKRLWRDYEIEQKELIWYYKSLCQNFKKFLLKGAVYWLLAIVFLVVMYLILKNNIDFSLAIFFSFLAAITFPHVLVIYKMKSDIHSK